MKVDVMNIQGDKVKQIELPDQFFESYEPSLIKRAILAIFSHKRQPYGAMPRAGMNVSAKLSRRRKNYKGSYNHGISRVPRKTMTRRGMQFFWVGALAPGTVKGRRAHPPQADKKWDLKINKKERRKAIRSALSGLTAHHKLLIVDSSFEELSKTKDVRQSLVKLGLKEELERSALKKVRAGKGKMRGRKYKRKVGALFVTGSVSPLMQATKNIPGFDSCEVRNLNAALLTRGHETPRLCIFTESALQKLARERLFL